jgi:hypothetical protein
MNVAADVMTLASDNQASLGMNFIPYQTINHMDAGFFQLSRPIDISGLIKTRAQFNHGCDLLSIFDRVFQAPIMRRSPPVRYSVCLIARTSGSEAACSRKSTTLLKFS